MSMSNFVRLMVFFDIPVKEKVERQEATKFRNFLLNDGYYMIQFSLYGRLCGTLENANIHQKRLEKNLPNKGSVRSMIITEKQYSSINILVGYKKRKERNISENQISFF